MSHLPPPTCVTIATRCRAISISISTKPPIKPLEPLTAAFLDRVLSTAGQSPVNHDGYLPLPPAALQKTRRALGLQPLASATVQ